MGLDEGVEAVELLFRWGFVAPLRIAALRALFRISSSSKARARARTSWIRAASLSISIAVGGRARLPASHWRHAGGTCRDVVQVGGRP